MSYTTYFDDANLSPIYSKFRPTIPDSLTNLLMDYVDRGKSSSNNDNSNSSSAAFDFRSLALDVGCGSGQATMVLAPFFKKVIGLDASPTQIAEAEKARKAREDLSNVEYCTHNSSDPFHMVADGSVGLVVSVAAAHWFDLPLFYANVDRALARGGTVAVIVYGLTRPSPKGQPKSEEISAARKRFLAKLNFGKVKDLVRMERVTEILREKYKEDMVWVGSMKDESEYYEETDSDLAKYSGFFRSLSSFDRVRREVGLDESERLLKEFQDEVKKALGLSEDVREEEVKLRLRTCYEIVMCRKP